MPMGTILDGSGSICRPRSRYRSRFRDTITRSKSFLFVGIVLAIQILPAASNFQFQESLAKLQKSDNCHQHGLHFCIHANGMCYGRDQYCEKGGDGKVQECLPKDPVKALGLCRKVLRNKAKLPHFQCEWACNHIFNKTTLSVAEDCPSPYQHVCQNAEDRCYGPEQFCEDNTINECLPKNNDKALQKCWEKIRNEADLPHAQCEWACEARFGRNVFTFSNSDDNGQYGLVISIIVIIALLFLVINCICLTVLYKRKKLTKFENVFPIIEKGSIHQNICYVLLLMVLLMTPFPLVIVWCFKGAKKPLTEGVDDGQGDSAANNNKPPGTIPLEANAPNQGAGISMNVNQHQPQKPPSVQNQNERNQTTDEAHHSKAEDNQPEDGSDATVTSPLLATNNQQSGHSSDAAVPVKKQDDPKAAFQTGTDHQFGHNDAGQENVATGNQEKSSNKDDAKQRKIGAESQKRIQKVEESDSTQSDAEEKEQPELDDAVQLTGSPSKNKPFFS